MKFPTLVLALALLAGCLGDSEAPMEGAAQPPGATGTPGTGPASCPPGGDPGTVADCAGPAPENVTERVSTPLLVEGSNYVGACAFAGPVGACQDAMAGENQRIELVAPGRVVGLAANVTWTAQTPAGDEMQAYLSLQVGDGWEWQENFTAVGPSPLVIDWDLSAYPEGSVLRLGVYQEGYEGAAGAGVAWALPQDFRLEGAIFSET